MLTTASIGVHIVSVGDFKNFVNNDSKLQNEWDKAVNVVDTMLFVAKRSGKNQVITSENVNK
jgi:hypothetical protein